ncbi:hypothetical protein TI03_01975 [Achromatium sp. WMS1]|nr:hypothetical protein TI03_01975 [Achromatium sp. WMS1]
MSTINITSDTLLFPMVPRIRKAMLAIFVLLTCMITIPIMATETNQGINMANTMANAMLNMMNAMGFNSQNMLSQPGSTWHQMPWMSTMYGLDGTWLSNNGERLSIQGSQFRLNAGYERMLEGTFEIRGHLLILHQSYFNRTWTYEYALSRGRLALRDIRGQVFLYKKIR